MLDDERQAGLQAEAMRLEAEGVDPQSLGADGSAAWRRSLEINADLRRN